MSQTTTVFIGHLFRPIPSLCQGMAVLLDDIAPYSFLIPFTTNGKNAHFTFSSRFRSLSRLSRRAACSNSSPASKFFVSIR